MQQPRQAGHLLSSPLWAQTPSSSLAELARDWGTLTVGSPEPRRAPGTGTRRLLCSSGSPHGATGDGEGLAGLQPVQTPGHGSDSFLGLQNARLSPCKSNAAGKGTTTDSFVPIIPALAPGACWWVGTPQSMLAQCCKDAHPGRSTARSCFGGAGEMGAWRGGGGEEGWHAAQLCLHFAAPPSQPDPLRLTSDFHHPQAVTFPETLDFGQRAHTPPRKPPPLAPGPGTCIHFHPG